MKELKHRIYGEGYLHSIELEETKNGDKRAIRGRVYMAIPNGTENPAIVVHNSFATEFTKNNDLNPAYSNLSDLIKTGIPAAAVDGDLQKATKIVVGRSEIRENIFATKDQVISTTQMSTNFFNEPKKGFTPRCEFNVEGILDSIKRLDNGDLEVVVFTVMYNGKLNKLKLVADTSDAISYIENSWQKGMLVFVDGYVDGKLEKVQLTSNVETSFGEAPTREVDKHTQRYVIRSGGEMVDTADFDAGEIAKAIEDYNTMVDGLLEKKKAEENKASAGTTEATGRGF